MGGSFDPIDPGVTLVQESEPGVTGIIGAGGANLTPLTTFEGASVPEPEPPLLSAAGLLGLVAAGCRQRRAAAAGSPGQLEREGVTTVGMDPG